MGEYEKQAIDFLNKTNSKIEIEFLKRDFHFDEDKEKRNIYKVTLSKGIRKYTFNFWDSIFNTNKSKRENPSNYDILACLNVDYNNNFEDFCSNYWYDKDSKKVEKIYNAVQKEQDELQKLYSDEEIILLNEIN